MVKKNIQIFKKLLIVYSLFLCGCKSEIISTSCPSPVIYSKNFKDNLKIDLKNNNSYFINQVVLDFFNLQEDLKLCNGVK